MARALNSVAVAAVSGLLVFQVQRKWIGLCATSGVSMLPTVDEDALLLVDARRNWIQADLKRGDVVVCRSVKNPEELLVKRVSAMSGDIMPESVEPINRFLRHADSYRVPLGHIWLKGDNGEESYDSRHFGPVPLGLVEGRLIYQLRPKFRDIRSTV